MSAQAIPAHYHRIAGSERLPFGLGHAHRRRRCPGNGAGDHLPAPPFRRRARARFRHRRRDAAGAAPAAVAGRFRGQVRRASDRHRQGGGLRQVLGHDRGRDQRGTPHRDRLGHRRADEPGLRRGSGALHRARAGARAWRRAHRGNLPRPQRLRARAGGAGRHRRRRVRPRQPQHHQAQRRRSGQHAHAVDPHAQAAVQLPHQLRGGPDHRHRVDDRLRDPRHPVAVQRPGRRVRDAHRA